jgi:hypothetical protein
MKIQTIIDPKQLGRTSQELIEIFLKDKKKQEELKFDYIQLDSSAENIKYPSQGSKIFIPSLTGKILITYPLGVLAVVSIEGIQTRDQLIKEIVEAYHEIYRLDKDSGQKIGTGIFRIWGHSLRDLVLHTINIYEQGIITLGIDS